MRRRSLTATPSRLRAAALAAVAVGFLTVAPAAIAAKPAYSLTFPQAGLPEVLTVDAGAAQRLFLPADPGRPPVRVRGRLALSDGVDSATISLTVGGRTLVDAHLTRAHPSLAFDSALPAPKAGAVTITVDASAGGGCGDRTASAVEVHDGEVTFADDDRRAGRLSTVLPSILRRLDLVVPASYTPAQAQAALRAASAIAARYAAQPLQVAVRAATDPLPSDTGGPLTRTIKITSGAPGVALAADGRTITVSGSASQLDRQVDLLTGELRLLALTRQATALQVGAPEELTSPVKTLTQLGSGPLRVTGTGSATIPIGFSQTDLGGRISAVQARLRGYLGPLPAGAGAAMTASVNGQIFKTWKVTGNQSFDHAFPVPASRLRRDNTLALQVRYALPGGRCAAADAPVELQVDPTSTLVSRYGATGPEGFDTLPQALLPTVQVALTRSDVGTLRAAVGTLVLAQRLGRRPLDPVISDVRTALASGRPALLAGPGLLGSSWLPVPLGEGVRKVGDAEVRQPTGPVGAIQAARRDGTEVLVASWTEQPQLLQDLLSTILDRPAGLSSVGTAQAILRTPGSGPVPIDLAGLRSPVPVAAVRSTPDGDDGGTGALVWILVGAGVLVVLAGAGFLASRRYW